MNAVTCIDFAAQIGIGALGVIALLLVAKKNRWGFPIGLLSQPFWFATAIINRQWGILILNLAYTATWAYGTYHWFCKSAKR